VIPTPERRRCFCPLAAADQGVVDVKSWLLRATSGSRVDTAVATTIQKSGRCRDICRCSVGRGKTRPLRRRRSRDVLPKPARDSSITIAIVEPIDVDLSGVPETLLGNLGRRAAAARIGALNDPVAIEVVSRLDYDFAGSARGARWHAVRVATFDRAVRRFLDSHPSGMLVALGEGLETQFWRLDNGQVRWLTVDVPETMELRNRLLPDGPRRSSHWGSALDLGWLDRLDPADPIPSPRRVCSHTSSAIRSTR
jgi:hypothetical protein